MIRLKSVRYLERHLGLEAAGHVTGVISQGIFVELDEIPAEGFLTRESLPAGVQFAGERLAWTIERSGWELRPGDAVRVQVVRADLRARRITLELIERGATRRGAGRKPAKSTGRCTRTGSRPAGRTEGRPVGRTSGRTVGRKPAAGKKRPGSRPPKPGRSAKGGRRRTKGTKPRGPGRRSS